MKNHLFAMAAMGTLALLASCSNEELPALAGNDGSITFTASLPADILSRAYGDGEVAKTLHYAVYESGSDAVVFASDAADSPAATVVSNTQFTLTLQLVKGKSYDFIFWADATEGSPYTFSSGTKSVVVSYEDLSANNEKRDAFFQAVKDLEISGPMQQPVELRRPLAQLNLLTSDLAAVTAAGTAVNKVDVTVKGLRNALNLYTGIATGDETLTFTAEGLPGQKFTIDDTDYDYLSMNYLLTGAELEADDVQTAKRELMEAIATVTFDAVDGKTTTIEVPNMPVQRNWRTNIYGALLTSPLDLTIDVMPEFFEPDNDLELSSKVPAVDASGNILLTSVAELEYIRSMVNAGTDTYAGKTIVLQNDIQLNPDIILAPIGDFKAEKAFSGIFDGNGHTISGLNVADLSGDNSTAGLFGYVKGATVRNLTLDGVKVRSNHFAGALAGLVKLSGEANPQNVFENVKVLNADIVSETFDNGGVYDGGNKVGGLYGFADFGLHVNGCTVQNSRVQGYREVGGLAGMISHIGDERTAFTNNSVINTVVMQDLRHDYKSPTPATIGALAGQFSNQQIDATNKATDVTIGTIYDGFVKEGNTFTVFNANGLEAMPSMIEALPISSQGIINIDADIDFSGKVWTPVKFSTTDGKGSSWLREINGNGHTIKNFNVQGQAMFMDYAGYGLTVKDLSFDGATVTSNTLNTALFFVQTYGNVTFENVTIKNSNITGARKVAAFVGSIYSERTANGYTVSMKNTHLENVRILATSMGQNCGAFAGMVNSPVDNITFENCSAKNVEIAYKSILSGSGKLYSTMSPRKGVDEAEGVTLENVELVKAQ
jgi:hypothetical protein